MDGDDMAFTAIQDLGGIWQCSIPGISAPVTLPGTLDESGIGFPDENRNQWHPDAEMNDALKHGGRIATRLTRRFTWEGPARITRTVSTAFPPEKRVRPLSPFRRFHSVTAAAGTTLLAA